MIRSVKVLVGSLTCVLALACGCATTPETPDASPMRDEARAREAREALARFFSGWTRNPSPARIAYGMSLLDTIARTNGEENCRPANMMPAIGFFAHVFNETAAQADEWARLALKLESASAREVIALALYLSGAPSGYEAFVTLREALETPPGGTPLMRAREIPPQPALDSLIEGELAAPAQLDYCWGAYLATGDVAFALRVFDVAMRESDEKIDGKPAADTTMSLARLSLLPFMADDARVHEAVNARLRIAPDELIADFCAGLDERARRQILDDDLFRRTAK